MIRHAMAYVARAQRVRAEMGDHPLTEDFKDAEQMLVTAEQQLVEAYGLWRALMRVAAAEGSALAGRYLEESTWDLT